jgi:hypothetical protein
VFFDFLVQQKDNMCLEKGRWKIENDKIEPLPNPLLKKEREQHSSFFDSSSVIRH